MVDMHVQDKSRMLMGPSGMNKMPGKGFMQLTMGEVQLDVSRRGRAH